MGILRTDKISGLETPTTVTGSVYFDGTGDYLAVTPIDNSFVNWWESDFTVEAWIYADSYADWYHEDGGYTIPVMVGHFDHNGNSNYWAFGPVEGGKVEFYYWKGSQNHTFITSDRVIAGEWSHIAMSYSVANGAKLFINGKGTDYISLSGTPQVDASTVAFNIGQYYNESLTGYVSNLRILNGTALYTSDFTPPTHELEVIGDTVLLCCNNPDSAGADGTGKTITANGDAAASTFSPGLTRDFTYGTEFKGVTTFDTQGYFVPPSGTTEQRGRGRGVFGGGTFPSPSSNKNTIDYIEIYTEGNAQDFGDLPTTTRGQGGCSSSTRGLFFSGYSGAALDQIEFVTIHTTGNGLDFGNLTVARTYAAGASSNTRGIFAGGYAHRDVIDYVTIAALGDAVDFGNLNAGTGGGMGSVQSPTRAVFAGGYVPGKINTIQYITIASTGDATDFGDLTNATNAMGGVSSQTRGVFTGGVISPSTIVNSMEYITIASTGNSQDFGDMVEVRQHEASASNTIRGVSAGGINPSATNAIDFVVIATTGNANSFGDLTERRGQTGGCSDSHGGIS